ncbi:MAG: Flp family type IVb pilin [Fibrobacterota bacterium]
MKFKAFFSNFIIDENGQGLTEYIIIVALVAVGALVAVKAFGQQIRAVFNGMTKGLAGKREAVSDYSDTKVLNDIDMDSFNK